MERKETPQPNSRGFRHAIKSKSKVETKKQTGKNKRPERLRGCRQRGREG